MEEQETVETSEAPEVSPEVESRAKSMGWIPKEEFKGDTSKWRPADEYVQRAEDLMPILRSQLGRYESKINQYESEITSLKSDLTAQKETSKKIVKMSETAQKMAYEQAKRDLTAKQIQAVADSDIDKWQALEEQKDNLAKPETIEIPEQAPTTPYNDTVFKQWHSTNTWYQQDKDMTEYAEFQAQKMIQQNPQMPYDQVLKTVEDRIKETFPNKFENPARQQASSVDSGSQRSVSDESGKKTYRNLPADAKEQCDKLVEQGIYTKDQYVKDYFEEE